MTTNVTTGTYRVNTLRFTYSMIINEEADSRIADVLNEQAQHGYLLDRILTNESPHEGHNYIWLMIVTRRVQ